MRYSVKTKDQIFVKGYGFLSFAKNMSKNIRKYISKILSCKYSQKLLDHAKQSATDAFKTASKIQKSEEAISNLIGIKIGNRILKVSKNSQQNNSETVNNEHDKETPKERYISPEERQEITDELRIKYYNNGISKSHKSFKKFTTK